MGFRYCNFWKAMQKYFREHGLSIAKNAYANLRTQKRVINNAYAKMSTHFLISPNRIPALTAFAFVCTLSFE